MPQMLAALEEKENTRQHVVLRYCAPALAAFSSFLLPPHSPRLDIYQAALS